MEIDDTVNYQGRRFVVRGFSRMSDVERQHVHIEDMETHEWLTVPLDDLEVVRADDDGG